MSFSNASIDEQNEAGRVWAQAFYDKMSSDTFNIGSWIDEFFQHDAVLVHTNGPLIKGHKDIASHVAENRQRQSAKYIVKHVDVVSNRIYTEVDAIIILKHDPSKKEIKLSGLAVFQKKIDENKLSSLKIYLDPTPLIERIKALS
ncbi:hypothetical protein I4U23_015513 [Adineta vaga]|nr:hypothetical protein I4U23_015513 [Adineta vaga]